MSLIEQLKSLGREPISSENPGGPDVRLEPSYAELQAEIDKLSSMTSPEVNWSLVADKAVEILKTSSKDLNAAVYLAQSLIRLEGLSSLGPSCEFLADLLDNFWDSLIPALKRLRARKNALDWWKEKTLAQIIKFDGQLEPSESELLIKALVRLDKVMAAQNLPSLSELIKQAKALPIKPPKELNEAKASQTQIQESQSQSNSSIAGPIVAQDLPVAIKMLETALESYLTLAWPESKADPWYWKISRLKAWMTVKDPPPHDETGATTLPGPAAEALEGLKKQIEAQSFESALLASEDLFSLNILWLDLQLISYKALIGLGFNLAAEAVKDEAMGLTARLPLLTRLSFADDSPLASNEVYQWLKTERSDKSQEEGDYQKRLEALHQSDPDQALITLSSPKFAPLDARALCLRRLTEIILWTRLGRIELALGLSDWLIADLDRRDLESWEPSLAIKILASAHEVYRSHKSEQSAKIAASLAKRLALLSPEEALPLKAPL
ncbi:MAG: TssA family type VI secretion system protein [Deltaproteobacteria bacterium]|nr:TssA family type VI secretion system protein [Deltaproteobacteria bacterium]